MLLTNNLKGSIILLCIDYFEILRILHRFLECFYPLIFFQKICFLIVKRDELLKHQIPKFPFVQRGEHNVGILGRNLDADPIEPFAEILEINPHPVLTIEEPKSLGQRLKLIFDSR